MPAQLIGKKAPLSVARLLASGEWYDTVSPQSIYETDFEDILLANGELLYPTFITTKFKCKVNLEYGNGIPDLALVDKGYRQWWVVEVELSSHRLAGDVERQVSIFSSGIYGDRHAEYLAQQSTDFDAESLLEMMRGRQPRVLVIVERLKPEWVTALARWEALIAVAELFRSKRDYILRVNGQHPEPLGDVVSVCRVDPRLRG